MDALFMAPTAVTIASPFLPAILAMDPYSLSKLFPAEVRIPAIFRYHLMALG
jgi:hypothetical protein